jgi:hypothetical protein
MGLEDIQNLARVSPLYRVREHGTNYEVATPREGSTEPYSGSGETKVMKFTITSSFDRCSQTYTTRLTEYFKIRPQEIKSILSVDTDEVQALLVRRRKPPFAPT